MKKPEVAKTWSNLSKEKQLKLELDFWSDAAIGLCGVIDQLEEEIKTLEAENRTLEAENRLMAAYLMKDE